MIPNGPKDGKYLFPKNDKKFIITTSQRDNYKQAYKQSRQGGVIITNVSPADNTKIAKILKLQLVCRRNGTKLVLVLFLFSFFKQTSSIRNQFDLELESPLYLFFPLIQTIQSLPLCLYQMLQFTYELQNPSSDIYQTRSY